MGALKYLVLLLVLAVLLALLEARRGGSGRRSGSRFGISRSRSQSYSRRTRPRTPEVYFPPISGQRVRLNGYDNRTRSSGNVEVFLRNQWGIICDDEWNTEEANVVCKQLGFTGGALSFTHQSHFGAGNWNFSNILMDDVECSGNEDSIIRCHYEYLSNCGPGEGAGVVCRQNTGCPLNWIAGPDSCYFLSNITTTKREFAANKCKKLGGYLVNIETEEENHFLSNVFSRDVGEPIITGALKKRNIWMWEKVLQTGFVGTPPPLPADPTPTHGVDLDNIVAEIENVFRDYLRSRQSGRRKRSPGSRRGKKPKKHSNRRQSGRVSGRNTVVTSRTLTSLDFFKWFPGWIPGSKNKQPTAKKNDKCIYLTTNFQHPNISVGLQDVGYLFWEDNFCKRTKRKLKKGFRFMCERPRVVVDAADVDVNAGNGNAEHTPQSRDCYSGNGYAYRGTHASTEKGTPCIPWAVATRNQPINKRINMNHNYCRNPDNDTRPWCFVDEGLKYGFCPLAECSNVTVVTTLAPITTTSVSECPDTEYYCRNNNKCISKSWYCDMEADCAGGEDEVGCDYKILQFKQIPNARLYPNVVKETFARISNETCAKYCLTREDYVCRSFAFAPDSRLCSLSDTNTQRSGSPNAATGSSVYELMSQTMDCAGMFTCDNGRCIDKSLLCNHADECGDFSDEESCWQNEPIEVRLVDGGETSGRIEVKYLGQWGTVCDDDWDTRDAAVVCKMLGYTSGTAKATSNSKYGQGSGKFFLDDVNCAGTEASIVNCSHAGWKKSNCRPHETAGVECNTRKSCTKDQYICSTGECIEATSVCDGICDCRPNCTDENGDGESDCKSISIEVPGIEDPDDHSVSGRVEIVMNGLRGTICQDGWDNNDAKVLCTMVGYKYGKALSGKLVEDGNGPVWLENVDCLGTEGSLLECTLGSWGASTCDHSEDAGVRCSNTPIPVDPIDDRPAPLRIELVDGGTANQGRVEVIKDGQRGTICDDKWDTKDATVVCRMLGYSGGEAKIEAHFGPGRSSIPIVLDDVECKGRERSIEDCGSLGWGVNDCGHGEDAGVVCFNSGDGGEGAGGDNEDLLRPSVPCGRRPLEVNSRKKREDLDLDLDDIRELAEAPKYERIVGGFTASQGFYPWQIGVRRHVGYGIYSHWCGGTIINDNWIVSAAHCFSDTHKSQIRVRAGDHDNKKADTYEQEFEAELIINHEQFDHDSFDNDIALIKVSPGITFSNEVQPACLPEPTAAYVTGQKCHVSGWGKTENGYQNMLKAARVPIVNDRRCKSLYFSKITPQMVCAGFLEGGIDTCAGDSGGPLVCEINGRYTLMGATSFGAECAKANAPGVYARVTSFLPWIKEKIIQNS